MTSDAVASSPWPDPAAPIAVKNVVGGAFVDAVTNETEPVLNPATGEVLAEVPLGSELDVDRAVRAAADAWEEWAETTPGERALALLRLADLVEAHAEELARLESLDVGKPRWLARSEIPFVADNLRFFAGAGRALEGRAGGEYQRGYSSTIRREPLGVVGAITPWNFPLMMGGWKIGPALAAGNCLVLKPSELTPLTTLRLAELAAEVLPPGVLNVITGHGATVGRALVEHELPRMISLTGSVETGKEIVRTAAGTLKRVHLELGGKAPVMVFDDADVELVVRTLRFASFSNTGQDCTAACRVLAQGELADALAEELKDAIASLRVGDPQAPDDVDVGPVVSAAQRERVVGFVERAVDAGAQLVAGGEALARPGFFVPPTIVGGVEQTSEIVQDEVFGPVVTIQRFDDEAQALAWANDVKYGLAASVFTGGAGRAARMSRALRFGTVWVNDHLPIASEMPFGGFKQSGIGKDMSIYAVEEYTQVKHVMTNLDA